MFISIQQPENLPWLGFFDKIRQVDEAILLDSVQFKKRYFENRNRIRGPDGWLYLTVPVISRGKYTQAIADVEIDDSTPWRKKHFRTLERCYHRAPYWEAHRAFFSQLYDACWRRLVDFNLAVITYISSVLGLTPPVRRTSTLDVSGKGSDLILGICKRVGATRYLSGSSGRDYLDRAAFERENVEVVFQEFQHPEYRQVYTPFVMGLAAVDLIFNEGPGSLAVIESARHGEE